MRTVTGVAVDMMIVEAIAAGVAALHSGKFTGAAGRHIDYPPNPGGVVRSLDEAQSLARQAGVDLDPELYRVVLDPSLPYDIRAQYFAGTSKQGTYTLAGMQTRDGRFILRVNPAILGSDQEIVGTLAHELHETQALTNLFEANGGRLTSRQLAEAINAPYGHLHQAAEAHEVAVVRRAFGGK